MRAFRFDKNAKFNRGECVGEFGLAGTPSSIGNLGPIPIYPFVYTYGKGRPKLDAAKFGGPWLCSQKLRTGECEFWETYIIADSAEQVGGKADIRWPDDPGIAEWRVSKQAKAS